MQVQKISNTIQKFDGVSYYRCGPYFQRKGKRLHRMVWEFHNGPIPDGYDVHHMDEDRTNNDIGNLQLLSESEHHSLHMQAPERKEQSRNAIAKAIEAARDWHSTPDGEAFHSKHAKEYWQHAKLNTYVCTYCGEEFQTKAVYGKGEHTFCCSKHKSYWRRDQGIDNETRTCPVCGEKFTVNRYTKKVCCSPECARKRRWGR